MTITLLCLVFAFLIGFGLGATWAKNQVAQVMDSGMMLLKDYDGAWMGTPEAFKSFLEDIAKGKIEPMEE